VSHAHGPLRHLLLCFPDDAALLPGYRAAYADLFAKLPASTELTVLAHPSSGGELERLAAAAVRDGRVRIVHAPEDLRFTVWAQDPWVVVDDPASGPCLVRPASFGREGDGEVADVLARATSIGSRQSSLWFHGGSVLVGDAFILVERGCLDLTLSTQEEGGATPVPPGRTALDYGAELFAHTLDPARKLIFVGPSQPVPDEIRRPITVKDREVLEFLPGIAEGAHPLGHLDMFITLAGRNASGRYRLVVGSPALADEVLGRPCLPHALSELFDDVAAQLVEHGFDVVRNPLPLTYADGRRSVEGQVREVRIWYFATANNCLVQIDAAAGDQVWLPTYGHGAWKELAATDEANRRIWEGLGFRVHQLTSFHAFAQRAGALHCIAKELER
jgi:hypothetical protein